MLRAVALASAVTALVAACGTPAAIQPTLDALASLGYSCGDGTADNVPSGLTQWSCSAPNSGSGGVNVDGNRDGVAQVTLTVERPDAPDPKAVRDEYRRLVGAVPPLLAAPVLEDALADWTGERMSRTIGGAQVIAECIQDQCMAIVVSTPNPIEPLRLP